MLNNMLVISKWKCWSIITTCCLGLIFALPNLISKSALNSLPSWLQNTVNLGLELKGGSHLQLEVDLKGVAYEYLHSLIDEVRSTLRHENIGYLNLTLAASLDSRSDASVEKKMSKDKKDLPQITFTLRDLSQKDNLKKIIQTIDPSLDVTISSDGFVEVILLESVLEKRNKSIIEQSIEVIRRRIDESGTKEPTIQRQGEDKIIVQLPGVDDPKEVKKLLGKTAKMTFQLVDHITPSIVKEKDDKTTVKERPPKNVEYLPQEQRDGTRIYLPVFKKVSINGDLLIDAQVSQGQHGEIAVSFKFNATGSKKLADISAKNLKKQFAIVLDGKVITAPVFQVVLPDGGGQITGNFSVKEASEMALLLRAGSLPAPLKIIEERTVGPSLGADSIRDGKNATIVAFIFVSLFMILSYALFGLFADIALFFNLILLFAGLSLLQATLTLPGIAGIALTIGMAVDANVLIYERIKEELRLKAKPVVAIQAGYTRAMTTIFDSNLTTLLGAAVLFEFGTGPIRGFAVTLALGILISLFTSLSLTRLIIVFWIGKRRIETLPI